LADDDPSASAACTLAKTTYDKCVTDKDSTSTPCVSAKTANDACGLAAANTAIAAKCPKYESTGICIKNKDYSDTCKSEGATAKTCLDAECKSATTSSEECVSKKTVSAECDGFAYTV